jgi:thioredoxin 1
MAEDAKEISSKDFEKKVLKTKGLILVDFFAPWCSPCQTMLPKIDEAAERFADKIKIYKVDINKSPELATKYSVLSVPTLIFFKNGKPIDQVGFLNDEQLMEKIEEVTE